MKSKIYLGLMGAFLLATQASANFLIHPQKLIFSEKKRVQSVQITNTDAEKKTYRMKFINYEALPNGGYKEIKEETKTTKFADEYLLFSPRKITLGPKKSQTIKVMVDKKAKLTDGEYRSHLMFLEDTPTKLAKPAGTKANGIMIDIQARYGITIPTIIRRGPLDVQGGFKSVSFSKNKIGQPIVKASLWRKGKNSYRGSVVVFQKGGWFSGDLEVGRLDNVALYSNISNRNIEVNLHGKDKNPFSMKTFKGEKFIVKFIGDEEDTPEINFEKELTL